MTKRECAVVMAYTGFAMLQGDDLDIFYKYCEELLGSPVLTHELAAESVQNEIMVKAKANFVELCRTARDE